MRRRNDNPPPGFPGALGVAITVGLVLLLSGERLAAQRGAAKQTITDKNYLEATQFLKDGGTYAFRKHVNTDKARKETEWYVIVMGPASLRSSPPKTLQLGSTFGKPVTVAELEGKEANMSPHARGARAIDRFRSAGPEAWNRFIDEVLRAMDRRECEALFVSVRPSEGYDPLVVLKVLPMTREQFVKQAREPVK